MLKHIEIFVSHLVSKGTAVLFLVDTAIILYLSSEVRRFSDAHDGVIVGFYNFRSLVITPILANVLLYMAFKFFWLNSQDSAPKNYSKRLYCFAAAIYLLVACTCITIGLHDYWLMSHSSIDVRSGISGKWMSYNWSDVRTKSASCRDLGLFHREGIYLVFRDDGDLNILDGNKSAIGKMASFIGQKTSTVAETTVDVRKCSKETKNLIRYLFFP